MLIISVISVRFFVPDKRISVKEIPVETFYAIRDTISMIKVETNPPVKNIAIQRKKTLTVDINRCDTAELIRLPGIGPVLSVRIIKYRQLLGGYVNKEQLKEVYGLPPETYETIMDMVTVDTLYIKKIEINSADYKILARMPYFTRSEVNSILKYRELEGRIKSLEELIDNKIIGVETARKVKSYMIFK